MLMKALPASFFNRPTLRVARDLIGCYLVRRRNGKSSRYMITETEAYDGPRDLACHAARGKHTKRNEVLFGRPGFIYIYFITFQLMQFNTPPSFAISFDCIGIAHDPKQLKNFCVASPSSFVPNEGYITTLPICI